MAISSGQVNLTANTAELVYETANGVETCLVVVPGNSNGVHLGNASVDTSSFYSASTTPITLTKFTGALYALAPTAMTINYLAANIA